MRAGTDWATNLHQRYPRTTTTISFAVVLAFGLYTVLEPEQLDGRGLHGTTILARRLLGVAVLIVLLAAALMPLSKGARRRGPRPAVSALDDGWATLLRRGWLSHAVQRLAQVFGCGAGAYFVCFILLGQLPPVLDALTVLIAAGMVAGLTALALPGQRPGSVVLRTSGVTHRQRGREATVRWDDVVGVTYEPGFVTVRTRRAAPVTSHRVVRGWTGRAHHQRYRLRIETHGLGVEPRTLALALHHYAMTPFDRRQLGTPDSLATIESLAHDEGPAKGTLAVRDEPEPSHADQASPRYPHVTVAMEPGDDEAPDVLLERTQDALAAAGVGKAELSEYWDEAAGDDDRHILATTRAWVTLVARSDTAPGADGAASPLGPVSSI